MAQLTEKEMQLEALISEECTTPRCFDGETQKSFCRCAGKDA